MKLLFLSVILCVLLCVSCKKEDVQPQSNEPKAGSAWSYKATVFTESGTVAGIDTISFQSRDTVIAGSTWTCLKETTSALPAFLIQKRGSDWWWVTFPNLTPSIWFKTNASVNDQYLLSNEDFSTDTAEVKSLNVSIIVPAGSFNCQHVQSFDDEGLKDDWYFSSQNGLLVKEVTYDSHTTGTGIWEKIRTELISFQR